MSENRLLVVEDDATSRDAMRIILTRRGWEVSVAEGLARLEPPPVCVILDLNLPDGSGVAILRAGRLGTCVVVCSGTDDPRQIAAVMSLSPGPSLPSRSTSAPSSTSENRRRGRRGRTRIPRPPGDDRRDRHMTSWRQTGARPRN